MKRFYKTVTLGDTPGGYSILLDGKPVKTPARHLLMIENENLAQAIMMEWVAQDDKILPDSMPLTQLQTTKIDRISTERAAMTAGLLKYIDTDLLCYRTEHPPETARRQVESWDPWLQWFAQEFGVRLETTHDLKALKQPAAAHSAVKNFVTALDDDHFTVLQLLTPLTGSLVLAIAFTRRALTPQQAFDAARVEENHKAELYNEEKYGPDPAQAKKDQAALSDLSAAAKFLDLLA